MATNRRIPCKKYLESGTCKADCTFNHLDETLVIVEEYAPVFSNRLAANLRAIQNETVEFNPPVPLRPIVNAAPAAASASAAPRRRQLPPKPCHKFFGPDGNGCRFGNKCHFSHDKEALAQFDCNLFLTRACPMGRACPMKHDERYRAVIPCRHYFGNGCKFPQCYRSHDPAFGPIIEARRSAAKNRHSAAATEEADDDQCVICFAPADGETIGCCNNFLHRNCLFQWFAQRTISDRRCPLCRTTTHTEAHARGAAVAR